MGAEVDVAAGMRKLLAKREADLAAGAEPVGWKIGINVPAVQEALGIDAPVAGYLTSAGVLEPGSTVDVAGWKTPMLEPEVAIRIGADGEPAALSPAFELVDIDLPFERIEPILERNVFHRAVVFGPETEGAAASGLRCRVLVDGEQAAAADVTDDPGEVVEHVRRFLAAHGAELRSGERIIAGSLVPPLPIEPGTLAELELGPLGSLAIAFE